jgi:CheY-like chemotaxis protein
VKIIAVTASAFEEDRQQALESGADDFISKPFREEVLFRKLEALTGVRYRFAEEATTRPKPSLAQPVSAMRASLAALPKDLLTKLRLAALSADLDRIMELAQLAEAQSPEIAQEIRRLAGGFSYKQLLALLEPESDS